MKKYSGVLGIVIFVTVSFFIVVLNYRSPALTISMHTAINQISTLSFCVFGCISSILIAYSLLFYLPRKWGLGIIYKIIASVTSVAFFVACSFPSDLTAITMHDIGAWGVIYSGLVFVIFLLIRLWRSYTVKLKIINSFLVALLVAMLLVQAMQNVLLKSFILYFESAFVMLVFVLILLLTFNEPSDIAIVKEKNE